MSNSSKVLGPKPFIRFNKIVFVDPQEPNSPYWWPAMVVPDKDIERVKQFLDPKFALPRQGECLVCYFEDGSFSTVSELETLPFSPYREPYLSYSKGSHSLQFINDSSVRWATKYYQKGKFPKYFQWLKVLNSSLNNPSPHPTPPYPSQLDKVIPKRKNSKVTLPSPQSTVLWSEEKNGRQPPPVNIQLELPPAVTSVHANGTGNEQFKDAVQVLCQLRTNSNGHQATDNSNGHSDTMPPKDYNQLQFRDLGILPRTKRQSYLKLIQNRTL